MKRSLPLLAWPMLAALLLGSAPNCNTESGARTVAKTLLEPDVGHTVQRPLSPLRYGIPTHDFQIKAHDGNYIPGWYLPHPKGRGRLIIFCHGFGDSRWGGLSMAVQTYRKIQADIILFDFRRHGASDPIYTTYGAHEKRDISTLIDWVAKRRKLTPSVGLIGWSMGATIALQAAGADPRIHAVIVMNPFLDLRSMANRQRPPILSRQTFHRGLVIAEKKAHFLVDEVSALKGIQRTKARILLIVGDQDRVVPPADGLRLYRAAPKRTTLWLQKGFGHMDWGRDRSFTPRTHAFFIRHLKRR
ncbi:MAG: alpha/beta fold hydrolase [Myxococcales bacterium]|nr:alpha/beta fold hydrolase [Myxococcales bacterium]